jgi:hypothetical protein
MCSLYLIDIHAIRGIANARAAPRFAAPEWLYTAMSTRPAAPFQPTPIFAVCHAPFASGRMRINSIA